MNIKLFEDFYIDSSVKSKENLYKKIEYISQKLKKSLNTKSKKRDIITIQNWNGVAEGCK